MINLLAATANGESGSIEALRLAADDVRTWYLHAVTQQPGHATSRQRNDWFWRDTGIARLLGRVAATLLDDPDPMVRTFAERALIPRDHFERLVQPTPDPPEHNGAPNA